LTGLAQGQRDASNPKIDHNEDFTGKVTSVSQRSFPTGRQFSPSIFLQRCFTL
jgi:hypothetical protein